MPQHQRLLVFDNLFAKEVSNQTMWNNINWLKHLNYYQENTVFLTK